MRYSASGLLSPAGHSQNLVNLSSSNNGSAGSVNSNKSSANSKKSQSFISNSSINNNPVAT